VTRKAAMWMSGDPEGAARALQQAVFIRVANRTLDNPQGVAWSNGVIDKLSHQCQEDQT